MKYILAVFAVVVASMLTASAIPSDDWLQARYDLIECRVDFTNEVIQDSVDAIAEAEDLADNKDELEEDLDELEGYLDDTDHIGFTVYALGTYWPNQIEATAELVLARLSFHKWGVTPETRDDLQEKFEANKDDFHECALDAYEATAMAKVEWYEGILEDYEGRVEDLEDKGLDGEGMQGVIDRARDEVITPLEDEIEDAETQAEMWEALGSYCLGNGCNKGENFHFWAWFALEKGKAAQDAMVDYVDEEELDIDDWDDMVEEAEGYLEDAEDALDDVGTDQFTLSTLDDVWDNLEDARDALRDMFQAMQGA